VVSGELPAARAAVLGEHLENHADQKAAYELLRQSEKSGRRLTNDEVREMIRFAQEAPERAETQETLFGAEETRRGLVLEKAEISAYVRQRLAREKKLVATVGTERAAQELAGAGK
jgi:hypothetical protein